jgi:hypothetical protein
MAPRVAPLLAMAAAAAGMPFVTPSTPTLTPLMI